MLANAINPNPFQTGSLNHNRHQIWTYPNRSSLPAEDTMKKLLVLWLHIIALSILTVFSLTPPINAQGLPGAIVYSVPGMDKVEVHPNLVYKKDGQVEMKMDVYAPANLAANERRPVVFFIHGGPLGANPSPGAKDWPFYHSYGRLMAASGLVGVTLDHRYASGKLKDLEVSFSDVEEAIRFARSNAASYHMDPERVALWAFSGGGPHISLGLQGKTPYIRCLVSFYGLLDLSKNAAGAGETPQALEKFSPIEYLSKASGYPPPVLIARAGLDSIEINRSIELFVSRMQTINGDISLLSHPLGLHNFDGVNNDDQSRDVIAATMAFLKSRLNRSTSFDSKRARDAAEFRALLLAGNVDAAQEYIHTNLNTPADKAVTDILLSEDQLLKAGVYISGLKNAPAAIRALEWMIELHPASIAGHLNIAFMYEMSGQIDRAVAEIIKVQSLLEKDTTLSEAQKMQVRQLAEAFLKRHPEFPAK
jgi:dienelactone hydrolase